MGVTDWMGEIERRRIGDPGWIRTSDLLLRRQLLYPLSYGVSLRVPAAQWVQRPTRSYLKLSA